ncbi:MAG: FeoB-associated Cys-rich membrane protein [Clostridia bacterium]|nr:FeoB-associated Cys-rich membrane protein [Clostridia bacterium]
MLAWLTANLGTVLITLLLAAAVAAVVVKLRRDKKKGASPCGGNCAHCAMVCACCQQKGCPPETP